jgi:hypothetical protein
MLGRFNLEVELNIFYYHDTQIEAFAHLLIILTNQNNNNNNSCDKCHIIEAVSFALVQDPRMIS